jgi:cytochrome P450
MGLERPPFWDDDLGLVVVSSYADADRVLRDSETFSSDAPLGPAYAAAFDRLRDRIPDDPRVVMASNFFRMPIQTANGAAHKRERSFIAKAFTPKRVRLIEPYVDELCAELTGVMVGRTEVPFVREFAVALPVQVIGRMLGASPEDHPQLKRWSDAFQAPIGSANAENLEEFVSTAVAFTDYFRPRIEAAVRGKGDELLALLAAENGVGQRLGVEEILAMCMALLLGGNETTTAGISGTMLYLVRAPGVQSRLRSDPGLIPAFVEETMRLSCPVQLMYRMATIDTEIAGVPIAKGDHVLLRTNAGNRDRTRFDDPMVPALDRPDARHLAFGRGNHVCPGAPLARLELRVEVETLLARTSAITLSDREDAIVAAGDPITAAVGEIYVDVTA